MYVKMMGYEPAIFGDGPRPSTPFRIFQAVQDVNLTHAFEDNCLLPDVFKLEVTFEDGVRITVDVLGTVYILNDQGKTIERFDVPTVTPLVPWSHKGFRPQCPPDPMPEVLAPYIPPTPRDAGGVYSEG